VGVPADTPGVPPQPYSSVFSQVFSRHVSEGPSSEAGGQQPRSPKSEKAIGHLNSAGAGSFEPPPNVLLHVVPPSQLERSSQQPVPHFDSVMPHVAALATQPPEGSAREWPVPLALLPADCSSPTPSPSSSAAQAAGFAAAAAAPAAKTASAATETRVKEAISRR